MQVSIGDKAMAWMNSPKLFLGLDLIYILSSSGPGPGPRSGPGSVPGQVQKVQGPKTWSVTTH